MIRKIRFQTGSQPKGFSLVELLVAISLLGFATIVAGSLLWAGVSVERSTNQMIRRMDQMSRWGFQFQDDIDDHDNIEVVPIPLEPESYTVELSRDGEARILYEFRPARWVRTLISDDHSESLQLKNARYTIDRIGENQGTVRLRIHNTKADPPTQLAEFHATLGRRVK